MLRVAICDDNIDFTVKIKNLLLDYCKREQMLCDISVYNHAEEVSPQAVQNIDLLLLDVEMGEKNGIEVAREIRSYNDDLIIVYISSYVEYATFGYNVRAFRYILKQDIEKMFDDCITSVLVQLNLKQDVLKFKINSDLIKVKIKDIIYLSSFRRKVIVKTTSKINPEYEFYSSLTEQERELTDKGFIRIQRGYLVNMEYIKKIYKGVAYLSNGEEIAISREEYSTICEKYMAYRSK